MEPIPAPTPPSATAMGRPMASTGPKAGRSTITAKAMPIIAEQAKHLSVFQRTPQWISPRDKYGQPMEPEIHWLMDMFPGFWNWARYMAGAPLFETHALVCTDPEWQAKGGKVNPVSDAMRGERMQQPLQLGRPVVGGDHHAGSECHPPIVPAHRRVAS